jgi:trimeric autotransporter adhesin
VPVVFFVPFPISSVETGTLNLLPVPAGAQKLNRDLEEVTMTAITRRVLSICLTAVWLCSLAAAQSVNSSQTLQTLQASAVVPRLVNYSGKAIDAEGKIISGTAGATFAIYSEQSGGAPLWMETQNVNADAKGNYTIQLGATKPEGLPLDVFASGEARWLGVTINGGEEQPRVMLLSVPYALKAGDAETIGGLPASAFMLAMPSSASASSSAAASTASTVTPAVSGTGTTDFLPLWTNTTGGLGNSALFQSGSGSTAKVGINSTTPASTLDVNGAATVRGLLNLPATGTATTAAGKNSQPFGFTASSYNSGTKTAVNQNFRWQAEPTGNNTTSASGTLNLLYSTGANAPAETGLKIAGNGQITFAAGQKFPGVGTGGVSSVGLSAPSSDFVVSGSPVTTSGTLALNWNTAPTNANTANAIVKRDSTGSFDVTSITAIASNGMSPLVGSDISSAGATAVVGNSGNGIGVFGQSGTSYGVDGNCPGCVGVYGSGAGGSGSGFGVYGIGASGVVGSGTSYGVFGTSSGSGALAVFGLGNSGATGVQGEGLIGVSGISADNAGVYAQSGTGGWAVDAVGTGSATGVLAGSSSGYAGWFNGNVNVEGTLSASVKDFKIDHPVDPANKYLVHASVESSEMMNIYTGNVTTDAEGVATVQLPEWFEALNTDFRYQLTVIGQFAQAIVAREIEQHQFQIKTSLPNVKVSWQVTGVRQDAYAKAHPLQVEQQKPEAERGFYIHPELYGAPEQKGVLWATAPQAMKQWKEAEAKAAAHGPTAKP